MTITITLQKMPPHCLSPQELAELSAYLVNADLDGRPFPLETTFDVLGLKAAIGCLDAVEGHEMGIRLLACKFARMALPSFERLHDDQRARQAIEMTERYARGEIDTESWSPAKTLASGAYLRAWAFRKIGPDQREAMRAAEAVSYVVSGVNLSLAIQRVMSVKRYRPDHWRRMNKEFRKFCRQEGKYAAPTLTEATP